jgi:hypothetical protein
LLNKATYTKVASATPPVDVAAINTDETPDATVDTAVASTGDPGQDVLNGMFNLFDKKRPVAETSQKRKKSARARRKIANGDSTLQLPRVNVERAPKRNFLDSLFGTAERRKKRKPLFSF